MKNLFDLTHKIILVTGGYGHLGSAMVEGLLDCGAVVLVAGRDRKKFEERFKHYSGNNLFFEAFDITRSSEYYSERYAEIVERYGAIDVVVNNAHSAKGKGNVELADEDWDYTLNGVLSPVQKSIKALVPIMKKQGKGKIINIASMYGHVSPNFEALYKGDDCEKYTNPAHYGASKAAMIQLTKYYAALLGKENIYVNTISPGPFSKDAIQQENPRFVERLKNANPLRKLGQPKDLKGIVILLASDASDFITGQNFAVDGGWTIW